MIWTPIESSHLVRSDRTSLSSRCFSECIPTTVWAQHRDTFHRSTKSGREVQQRWPGIATEKVFLMGFSGGGQYAHRFLYLYPERLHAVSVGAPGRVTRLNETLAWPTGIKDVEEKFGKKVEREKIKSVKSIQMVVGSKDTEIQGGNEYWAWLEERKRKSRTENKDQSHEGGSLEPMRTGRVETLQKLQKAWAGDGIEAQLDIVPGVAHESAGIVDTVLDFFQPLMTEVHREIWM
jgi:pimeloyl-ACP methyl ester carboxylesterase